MTISDIALQQLIDLVGDLNSLQISEEHDLWTYIWGTPFFSSAKAYVHLTGYRVIHAAFNWLWNQLDKINIRSFFG